jgi:hypothetical protein
MSRWYRLALALALGLVAITGCLSGAEFKETCDTDADCFVGYACADEPSLSAKICFRRCAGQSDCLDSQTCDIVAGDTEGVCRAITP